jgi:hypothetical protein
VDFDTLIADEDVNEFTVFDKYALHVAIRLVTVDGVAHNELN